MHCKSLRDDVECSVNVYFLFIVVFAQNKNKTDAERKWLVNNFETAKIWTLYFVGQQFCALLQQNK